MHRLNLPKITKENLLGLTVEEAEKLDPSQVMVTQNELLELTKNNLIPEALQKILIAKRQEAKKLNPEDEIKALLLKVYRGDREIKAYMQSLIDTIRKTIREDMPVEERLILEKLQAILAPFKQIATLVSPFEIQTGSDELSETAYNDLAKQMTADALITKLDLVISNPLFTSYLSTLEKMIASAEKCNDYLAKVKKDGDEFLLYRLRDNIKAECIYRGLEPVNAVDAIFSKVIQRLPQAVLTLNEAQHIAEKNKMAEFAVSLKKLASELREHTQIINQNKNKVLILDQLEQRADELSKQLDHRTVKKQKIDKLFDETVNLHQLIADIKNSKDIALGVFVKTVDSNPIATNAKRESETTWTTVMRINEMLLAREYVDKLRDAIQAELKDATKKMMKRKTSSKFQANTSELDRYVETLTTKFNTIPNREEIKTITDAENAFKAVQTFLTPSKKGFLFNLGKKDYSINAHNVVDKIFKEMEMAKENLRLDNLLAAPIPEKPSKTI